MIVNMNLRNDYKLIIDNLLTSELGINSNDIPTEYDRTVILFSKLLRQKFRIDKKWDVIIHPDVKIPTNLENGFNSLISALKTGQNIYRYMTTRIENTKLSDPMLDCDNIYHFHLSDEPYSRNQNFNERTNERAFVYFDINNNTAYIIDVYPHGAEKNLIKDRIMKLWKQYPEACQNNIQEGKLSFDANDEQIASMRQNDINGFIQLDDNHFFVSTGGLSCDGTAIEDSLYMTKTNRCIQKLEDNIKNNIKNKLSQFNNSDIIDITIYNKKYDVWLIIKQNKNIIENYHVFSLTI